MKKLPVILVVLAALFLCANLFAQDSSEVYLVGPRFASYMKLTEAQRGKTDSLIANIKSIQAAEKTRFDEMRKKRENGEQFDREEMMKRREQREKDFKVIKDNIEKIKAELTTEQLELFKNVKVPNLEMRRRQRP